MNRDEAIAALLRSKAITQAEAEKLKRSTKSDDSVKVVIGYLREMGSVSSQEIAKALNMSATDVANIEPRGLPLGVSLPDIGDLSADASWSLPSRSDVEDLDPKEQAKIRSDATVFLRDVIDRQADYISPDMMEQINRTLNWLQTVEYDPDNFNMVADMLRESGVPEFELNSMAEEFGDIKLGSTAAGRSWNGPDIRDIIGTGAPGSEDDRLAPMGEDGVRRPAYASLYGTTMEEALASVDSNSIDSSEMSFLQELRASGVISENQTITTLGRADYTGGGKVVDRATGQVLSHDLWNLIKTSQEARDIYRARTNTLDSITNLLSSGKFTYKPEDDKTGSPDKYGGAMGGGRIPVEDLAIPTLSPTGAAWEAPTYDYKAGGGQAEWIGMSSRQRQMRINLMVSNGLIHPEDAAIMKQGGASGSPLNLTAMNIWETATSISSEFQYSPLDAISALGREKAMQEAAAARARGGGGRVAPTYSVPASLREIPDYKTLAQNTKSVFRNQLGRDMEDWELFLYADELKNQHVTANEQRIQIHKEAWDEAVAGGSTDVDFTAVEDPNTALDYDIETAYAGEIDRNQDVADNANRHNLLMSSIATGRRMI